MIENTTFKAITPAIQDSYCGPAKCPREILAHILSYLSYRDLKQASLVCYEFNEHSQSLPKAWLKRLCNATAIVFGVDMRDKVSPNFKDGKYEGIAEPHFLFWKKEEIVWCLSPRWKNDDPTSTHEVFYSIKPPFREVKVLSVKYIPSSQIIKINDCLICANHKLTDLFINKYTINESNINRDTFSFHKDKQAAEMIISNITSEGFVAIGEMFEDRPLKITIRDYIKQITTEIEIDAIKGRFSIGTIALFSFKGESHLALIHRYNDSPFLSIFSCKDKQELARVTIAEKNYRKKILIEEEKLVLSNIFKYTEVFDLKTLKIIFSQDGYHPRLQQNKLILINNETNNIEIHTLSSPQPTNPITIPVQLKPNKNDKQYAVSDDLIAAISGQDIKLFNLNTGEHITTFSTAKIDKPGIPYSIYFEMQGIDSYLCVILEDTRVIYYSPKDFTNPGDHVVDAGQVSASNG